MGKRVNRKNFLEKKYLSTSFNLFIMTGHFRKWFLREGPQNFMIKRPYAGFLILAGFSFLFGIMYRPLGVHPGRFLSFEGTMLVYSVSIALFALGMTLMVKRIAPSHWTLPYEIFSIIMVLLASGTGAYFAGFLLEDPAGRLNLATFMNSLGSVFLVGLIPYFFFMAMNARYWFLEEQQQSFQVKAEDPLTKPAEEKINIVSQLKGESLSFYPDEFLYAVSEGNYISFFLERDQKLKREVIRNTIHHTEQQLASIPYVMRTHRAFIVNLRKVTLKKGNTLGYQLTLQGINEQVPVSRKQVRNFNDRMKNLDQ